MPVELISLYSQKITTKQLNYCRTALKSRLSLEQTSLVHEKIKSLEAHCQQFRKLHIQWKALNCCVNQKMKHLSSQKNRPPHRLSSHESEEPSSTFIPYAGLSLGTLTGLLARTGNCRSLDFKNKDLAKKVFEEFPLLQTVNFWKQMEIKHFSLAIPLLPLAAQVIGNTVKGPKDQKITQRFKTALSTCATAEQRAYLLAAIMGMIGVACYPKEWADKYFDPSGHIMLKTILTTLTAKTLSGVLANAQNRALILGSSALYAITDAVLIHTTVSVCHSVPELVVGFAAAWSISALAQKAIQKLRSVKL